MRCKPNRPARLRAQISPPGWPGHPGIRSCRGGPVGVRQGLRYRPAGLDFPMVKRRQKPENRADRARWGGFTGHGAWSGGRRVASGRLPPRLLPWVWSGVPRGVGIANGGLRCGAACLSCSSCVSGCPRPGAGTRQAAAPTRRPSWAATLATRLCGQPRSGTGCVASARSGPPRGV